MGCEVKRVPSGFGWPLNTIWDGYLNPHPAAEECAACGGTGYNPETRLLSDLWHDHHGFGRRWTYA